MSEMRDLREREKELRCLYRVNEIVSRREVGPESVFDEVLKAIPSGWQRPEQTGARIRFFGRDYVGPTYDPRGAIAAEPLRVFGSVVGSLDVSDSSAGPERAEQVFLAEERVLLRNVAERLAEYLEWKQTELLGMRVPVRTEPWRWREDQARALAASLDAERLGVAALFLGGSTHEGTAGPASDIDLYFVFRGDAEQKRELASWLAGWNACVGHLTYRQTGYAIAGGLFDFHWLDAMPGVGSRSRMTELTLSGQRARD